jgi:hypothetical protein
VNFRADTPMASPAKLASIFVLLGCAELAMRPGRSMRWWGPGEAWPVASRSSQYARLRHEGCSPERRSTGDPLCQEVRLCAERCATNGKESRRRPKPVNSSARRWMTFARVSTEHGRRSRLSPSASPRLVARAYRSRRPSVAQLRIRREGRRRGTWRGAGRARSGRLRAALRRLSAHSSANHAHRRRMPPYRNRPALRRVGALRLSGRSPRRRPRVRRVLEGDPRRRGAQLDPASLTRPRSTCARDRLSVAAGPR